MKQQLIQRMEILGKLRNDIFGHEEKTRNGNIVSNAFWGFWPTNEERYINPKMENELVVFKKKIAARFETKQISKNFEFPRIGSQLHYHLHQKYNFIGKDISDSRVQSLERNPERTLQSNPN